MSGAAGVAAVRPAAAGRGRVGAALPTRSCRRRPRCRPTPRRWSCFVPAYDWDVDLTVLAGLPRLRVVQTLTAGVEHVRPFVPAGVRAVQRPRHPRHLDRRAGAHPDPGRAARRPRLRAGAGPARVGLRCRARRWPTSSVLIVGYGSIGAAIEARLLPFEAEVVRVARTRPRRACTPIAELPGLLPGRRRRGARRPPHRGDPRAGRRRLPGPDEAPARCWSTWPAAPSSTPTPWSPRCTPGRIRAAARRRRPRAAARRTTRCGTRPGLLVSPHVGGASSAMWPRAHRLVREQLERYAAGEPLRQHDDRRLLTLPATRRLRDVAGRIREEDIAEVREKARIDDVVSSYVTLRPAGGGSLKGLCPFHDEKSPSFHVTPARQFWHCFGCGEGGDVFTFVMKIDGLELRRGRRAAGRQVRRASCAARRATTARTGPSGPAAVAADRGAPGRPGVLRRAAGRRPTPLTAPAVPGRARLRPGRPPRRFGVGFAPRGARRCSRTCARKGFTRRGVGRRRAGRRRAASALRPVPRPAAVADPRRQRRHDRLRRAADLRRRPDRGQVPQHPRDADLQEEPGALRHRPGPPRHRRGPPRRSSSRATPT